MKLLFDENISWRIVKKIIHLFPGSESSVRLRLTGHKDDTVWKTAKRDRYDIVTFDEDYSVLSQERGFPPKVIVVRTGNMSTQPLADLLIRNHEIIVTFLTNPAEERGCLELVDFTSF